MLLLSLLPECVEFFGNATDLGLQKISGRRKWKGIEDLGFRIARIIADTKLGVILPLPCEVGINLDAMADVANKDEGRSAVRWRQGTSIFFSLSLGVDHQDVPGAARTGLAAL